MRSVSHQARLSGREKSRRLLTYAGPEPGERGRRGTLAESAVIPGRRILIGNCEGDGRPDCPTLDA